MEEGKEHVKERSARFLSRPPFTPRKGSDRHVRKPPAGNPDGLVRILDSELRLIKGGGVYWKEENCDEGKIKDELAVLPCPVNGILRAGKRRVVRLVQK